MFNNPSTLIRLVASLQASQLQAMVIIASTFRSPVHAETLYTILLGVFARLREKIHNRTLSPLPDDGFHRCGEASSELTLVLELLIDEAEATSFIQCIDSYLIAFASSHADGKRDSAQREMLVL